MPTNIILITNKRKKINDETEQSNSFSTLFFKSENGTENHKLLKLDLPGEKDIRFLTSSLKIL
jgi:hypothetical protein